MSTLYLALRQNRRFLWRFLNMTRRFSILDLRAKEQTEAREAYFADLKRKFGDLQANVRFPLQTLNARPSGRGSARLRHLRFPFKP